MSRGVQVTRAGPFPSRLQFTKHPGRHYLSSSLWSPDGNCTVGGAAKGRSANSNLSKGTQVDATFPWEVTMQILFPVNLI